MKVGIIGIKGLPAKGGAERVVEAIVRRIKSKGVSPTVYCDANYTPPDFRIDGVELIRIPAISGKHLRTFTLALFSSFHALIFGKYDLIHLHNIEISFILPVLRLKFKVIGTGHGFAYWRLKWGSTVKKIMKMMNYLFVRYSNIVSSVSAKDAKYLEERFGRQVLHIANGVGTEFHPDFTKAKEILKKHGINKHNYLIFVSGRIEPTKGAHLAIEAVNQLNRDIPLLVVGDNNQVKIYGEKLLDMAGPRVNFQSLIKDPSVLFGLMKYATCLIFPSLREAMSMVLLEAASFGVPVICSDIEENKDVLGTDGIYFKSGDVESLKEKINWILEHREDININAGILQKHIHNKYSWDTIANQYLQIYKEAACS